MSGSLFKNPLYVSGFINFDIGLGLLLVGVFTGNPIILGLSGGFLLVSAVSLTIGIFKSK
jgi:hypothetical protein